MMPVEDPDEATAAAEAAAAKSFPIPKNPVDARTLYTQLHAALPARFPQANDQSYEYKGFMRHLNKVGAVAHPLEPAVAPAGPTWRERKEHRATVRDLRSELINETEAGSEGARAVIEDTIAEQKDFTAKQPPQPKPGEVTWQDVDRTPSLQRWSPDHKRELVERMKGAGVNPQETVLVGAAIQDFRELRPAAWDRPPADYDEATRTKAERALAVLYPDAATREDLRGDGLWNQGGERLIAALVELGERLATR